MGTIATPLADHDMAGKFRHERGFRVRPTQTFSASSSKSELAEKGQGEDILLYLDVQDNLESFTLGIGDVQADESLVVFIP